MHKQLPTPEEALAALKKQPGIDITKQQAGHRILVETDNSLFDIEVLNPAAKLIKVYGTTPALRGTVIGQYVKGVYVLDGKVSIDNWIGRTMRMLLHFRNGDFLSGPVITATVSGPGWKYDIF